MNPKPGSIFWFAAWRIGAITLLLSLIGYIIWHQQYTFTDEDVQYLCGVTLFRTQIALKEGQTFTVGRLVDGSRVPGGSGGLSPGTRKAVVAVGFRDESLTVSFLFEPLREQGPIPGMGITTRSTSWKIDNVKSNGMAIWFNEQPDGVWLAEWEEEKDGKKQKVRYGYWIE